MGTAYFQSVVALAIFAATVQAAPKGDDTVVLYQIGKAGNYCVSISTSEKGCISGTHDSGDTINLMNLTKGKTVVFRNLSDAPHDMRFTGANAEDLPPQAPSGADAQKRMAAEDPTKQRISCSFHGDQLAVGYRVQPPMLQKIGDGGGHKDPLADASASGGGLPQKALGGSGGGVPLGGGGGGAGIGKMLVTGLADVAPQVLAKGRPEDVANLVAARPELLGALQGVRPLLAKELTQGGIGKPGIAMLKPTGGGAPVQSPFGSQLLTVGGPPVKGGGAPGANVAINGPKLGGGGGAPINALATRFEEMEEEIGDGTVAKKKPAAVVAGRGGRKVYARRTGEPRAPASDGFGVSPVEGGAAFAIENGGVTLDRTRMKLVGQAKGGEETTLLAKLHTWIILGLLVAFALLARSVIGATRTKRKA